MDMSDSKKASQRMAPVPVSLTADLPRADEAVADLQKALLGEMRVIAVEDTEGIREGHTKSAPEVTGLTPSGEDEKKAEWLKTPGGFRRDYLHSKADEEGRPMEERPAIWKKSLVHSVKPLFRIGYFENVFGIRFDPDTGEEIHGPPPKGQAGITMVTLALLKSFIGSGVTFLPGSYKQGGWLFSPCVLIFIGLCNAICIKLLLDAREKLGFGSFADIAYEAAGTFGKRAVQISLVLSQYGTCVAYMVFIAKMADSLGFQPAFAVIAAQLPILMPLSLIRSVHQLEYPNLIADALIVIGLGVAISYNTAALSEAGGLSRELHVLKPFLPDTCGLFIGTAIFTFEGIPMILPIRDSMVDPTKFWPLFKVLFFLIVMFFAGFGLLGYLAYGETVETIVLMNLPLESGLSRFVRGSYMAALILGFPLMFLPAAQIMEYWIFGAVPKGSKKWPKNFTRFLSCIVFAVVALFGGPQFEKVLAIIGALCCAPIAFIYPAYCHLKCAASGMCEVTVDCVMIALGTFCMFFALQQTFAV